MVGTVPASQIPQHVAAELSHLTSRPGVQSTLILSRKDGSIIQVTGELARQPSPRSLKSTTSPQESEMISLTDSEQSPTVVSTDGDSTVALNPASTQSTPYKPSQAETLAAHIYAFVSSAAGLSTALSNPSARANANESEYGMRNTSGSGTDGHNGPNREADNDFEAGNDREDDDEVKLLRLRTKIHEIIIIPNRRFLLCVVHDVCVGGTSGGGGAASNR